MGIAAEADDRLISVRIHCDGRNGECSTSFEHEHPHTDPIPDPTTGRGDDPAWAPLKQQATQAQRLAEKQGWRIDGHGEFCPPCAPHVDEDDDFDDEEWWRRADEE